MRFGVMLLLALAIACDAKTPTAPDTASLRFIQRVAEPGSSGSVTAEAGEGRIAVRATLSGPDPCRTLEGELDQTARELKLRVFVRPSGAEGCVQVVGSFSYDAAIEQLPRGTYVLRVVHAYPSTGWTTQTVLSETLEVR